MIVETEHVSAHQQYINAMEEENRRRHREAIKADPLAYETEPESYVYWSFDGVIRDHRSWHQRQRNRCIVEAVIDIDMPASGTKTLRVPVSKDFFTASLLLPADMAVMEGSTDDAATTRLDPQKLLRRTKIQWIDDAGRRWRAYDPVEN